MHLSKITKGTLIWVTGVAGAGKTTISKKLLLELKKNNYRCIHLDGDSLRDTFSEIVDQSSSFKIENRKKLAHTYFRLCKLLTEQDYVVIISSISLFKEIYTWNKKNFDSYYLIYLNFSKQIIYKRNQKKLYSGEKGKKTLNIVGLDIKYDLPTPDLEFGDEFDNKIDIIVKKIIQFMV